MDARRKLFREQATSRRQSKWLGGVTIASPPSHIIWAISFTSLGLIVLAGLYFGEYTRRERVVGQLVSHDGVVKISSATTGYVTRVLLNETNSARSGEPVVEIDGEAYSAGGTGVKGGVSLALEAQRRALHAEMLVSRDAYTRNIESIKIQIPLLESQLADAVDELNIYQQEQVDQQLLLDKIEPLLKSGYIAATQVQQQRSSLASVKANVRSQRSKISSIRLDLEGRRADLARAPLDLASQINTSERLLASADVEAQSNAGDLSSALLSPVNGIVSSVLVSEGQAVKPGQILMTIIKDTSKSG